MDSMHMITRDPTPFDDPNLGLLQSTVPSARLYSVDFFRGLTMILMLFVDVCGDTVPFFAHSAWHGLNLADLVMPAFLFISGASTFLSLAKGAEEGSKRQRFVDAAWRSLRLFLLGVFLQGSWLPSPDSLKPFVGLDLLNFRVMGILQRIGLCYLAMNAIVLHTQDTRKQVVITSLIIFFQTAILLLLPVPNCPHIADFSMECNAESYIDRIVFGSNHLYRPLLGFDPEGLISSCGALLSIMAGYWALQYRSINFRSKISIGLVSIISGCIFQFLGIPFNKALWTLSYNFTTIGLIYLAWTLLALVEDGKFKNNLITTLGMNGILFFVLSDCGGVMTFLIASLWVPTERGNRVNLISWFKESVLRVEEIPNNILIYCVLEMVVFLLFMRELHKRKIFLRI